MKIGITERGDAGIDLSWESKLNSVDGAVLVTKNITNDFIDAVLRHKEKTVVHVTCTGYGGTIVEPKVPKYRDQLAQAKKLVEAGFPINRIVIRVDPIIPTKKGLAVTYKVFALAYAYGFKRFRVSVIDMYPHVRDRFKMAGLPCPYGNNFTASDEQFAQVDATLNKLLDSLNGISIECCAEPKLFIPQKTGCVGTLEAKMFGLPVDEATLGKQRRECLCLDGKTELLDSCHRCKHGCLYCYWKD